MLTNETKIAIVAEALTTELTRAELAKKHNVSTRSIGRWVEKFEGEAKALNEQTASEAKAPTKKELAEQIFNKMAGERRKDIIAAFQAEADLTEQGAATYFYNLTKAQKAAQA